MNFRCNQLICEAAKHVLLYYYCNYGPSLLSSYLSNNGLLILSRYPITSSDYISFNNCISYDTIIEKGCNYIKINVFPNLDINIFNSHLQSSYKQVDPECENIRKCQLYKLKQFINSKCNPKTDAVICGGDFNINSKNSNEYSLLNNILSPLTDSLKDSNDTTIKVAYNIDGTEATQISPVCNKCHPLLSQYLIEDQRLDYIYYNHNNNRLKYKTSKILPLRINRSDLDFNKISDHDAIYTEFTYK